MEEKFLLSSNTSRQKYGKPKYYENKGAVYDLFFTIVMVLIEER